MIIKSQIFSTWNETTHSSLSLSLSSHILSEHPGQCVSVCSHFHTFTHLLTSLQLFLSFPPSLLLALDSLSLAFRLPANTHSPFLSRSFYQKLLCGARQVSGAYKLVFLYFLNAYLYSYDISSYHCEGQSWQGAVIMFYTTAFSKTCGDSFERLFPVSE